MFGEMFAHLPHFDDVYVHRGDDLLGVRFRIVEDAGVLGSERVNHGDSIFRHRVLEHVNGADLTEKRGHGRVLILQARV